MRTTLIIDDGILAKATSLTGITEKTRLVHMGLEALIHRESARRLSALGGSMPDLVVPPRRRSDDAPMGDSSLKVAEKPAVYGAR
jgi:Arc/MetJ family transcription regulator